MAKEMGLIAAMKDFFGFKEGQKLQDFSAECKIALADPKDRAFYTAGLEANGYIIKVTV